jgi:hypothetical protein
MNAAGQTGPGRRSFPKTPFFVRNTQARALDFLFYCRQ